MSLCPPQEWVTSTELLISLDRLNTFGDDIFKDPKVLQSYYYAVSDFSVGGRWVPGRGPAPRPRAGCGWQPLVAGERPAQLSPEWGP